jgi:hypothetical protein
LILMRGTRVIVEPDSDLSRAFCGYALAQSSVARSR